MLLAAANDLAGLEAKLEEWKGDEAVEEEVHEAKAAVTMMENEVGLSVVAYNKLLI